MADSSFYFSVLYPFQDDALRLVKEAKTGFYLRTLGLSINESILGAQSKSSGIYPLDLARRLCSATVVDWEAVTWIEPVPNPDSGEIKAHFYAGDAVEDVLVSIEFIVVTYFDESALNSRGIEGNGVVVFSSGGEFLYGYGDSVRGKAVDVADCYAACWHERSSVLFYPYTEFPLVITRP